MAHMREPHGDPDPSTVYFTESSPYDISSTDSSYDRKEEDEEDVRVDNDFTINRHRSVSKNHKREERVDQIPFSLSTRGVIFRHRSTPYFVCKSDPASYIDRA